METDSRFPVCIVVLTVLTLGAARLVLSPHGIRAQDPANASPRAAPVSQESREDAYRANNIGVALLEQFKYKEAGEKFRRALEIDRGLAIAHLNLCIALYNTPDVAAARVEAKIAVQQLPNAPPPHYMLGLIARAENRPEEAIASFKRVLELDPRDVGSRINLGQLYLESKKYSEAIPVLREALATEPYSVTASYNMAIALLRSGKRDEGMQMMQRFQSLRASAYGTTIGQKYLEQGRYAEAVASTGLEADVVSAAAPDVVFTDATASSFVPSAAGPAGGRRLAGGTDQMDATPILGRRFKAGELTDSVKKAIAAAFGGSVLLFDYDGDGDLDMFVASPYRQRLFRNDGGRFVDVTEQSGLSSMPEGSVAVGAVAGDYDNDGRPDLFVLRYGVSSLYHNDGNGKFSEVTATAAVPAYPYLALSAAFVDVDHDGDLDIFIAGFADLGKASSADPGRELTFPDDFPSAPNLLLRNDGNGKFTDITAAAKVAEGLTHGVAVVPTDYDNHRDVDLFILNYGQAPTLLSNMRDGTFRNVAAEVGLTAGERFTSVAAGDVNKDGYIDFFLGRADGPGVFAMSDGHGRFVTTPAPAGSQASAALFLDYDNDGLLDLVLFSAGGLRVFRNTGGKWTDVSERAVAPNLFGYGRAAGSRPGRALAAGDLDGDGDTDLVALMPSGDPSIGRNDGGSRNHSIRVQLAGKVSNRSGVGARIEARAGSLWQQIETSAATPAHAPADVIFGLGKRPAPDALRVLWPAGIVQAEVDFGQSRAGPQLAETITITELDRKPSSCPYLYTWNGERFEFITDFMGGGEMGYWEGPGRRNSPIPEEYVRIRGDQLKPRRGRYEIRVTNELEEVLYLDRLQLLDIQHPADTEVFPNEQGLIDPPRPPFKLYATRGAHPPLAATDDHARDVLPLISRLDRRYPDDFCLGRIRGYAEEHTLTLDLGKPGSRRTLLLLTGWTDYAFSSDNVAASQAGLKMTPPALEVKEGDAWRTAIPDMGFPIGRPQTMVVDLTGMLPATGSQVRIVTNMRIYWDQILVDTSDGDFPMRITRLDPVSADLHWRGYSAETSPDGKEPFGCDYARVSADSPWKVMPGRYTREGDVRELLLRSDDMFVVSRPGDEIALSFNASLAPLPAGWKHTFLLYADGFSKEMDINSASPDRVAPLPFHGMKSYPYGPAEPYPARDARLKYIQRYNTRVVAAPLPRIEALGVAGAAAKAPGRKGQR